MTEYSPDPPLAPEDTCPELPEGIRRSKAALRRDLPVLWANQRYRGKCVCYRGDERVGIGDYLTLLRECYRRNFQDGEFIIETITPDAGQEVYDVDRIYPDPA